MNEQEDLYAQYEDAFFALLMNEVAEAEGQELLKKNLTSREFVTLCYSCLRTLTLLCRRPSANAAYVRLKRAAEKLDSSAICKPCCESSTALRSGFLFRCFYSSASLQPQRLSA